MIGKIVVKATIFPCYNEHEFYQNALIALNGGETIGFGISY